MEAACEDRPQGIQRAPKAGEGRARADGGDRQIGKNRRCYPSIGPATSGGTGRHRLVSRCPACPKDTPIAVSVGSHSVAAPDASVQAIILLI